ncbi:hypothetical protein NQ314_007868 [Rhamnusium bicolor]|uniref:Nuclease HARBI1 n=1 Tax=Rhamnusium bicolor TaxID=1586634 RepID=A0AAV8YGC3_9CUCU|nr:hypothetical protein NQ314_007868 [Rhamnusium bicolor]
MSDISSDAIDTSSSSISDSAEELENEVLEELLEIRTENENYFKETIPRHNEQEFIEHFRVTDSIAERFENNDYYKRHTGVYGKKSALKQTCIFLWFVGHQTASFTDVADRFSITISSLFRVVKRMVYFLSNLSPTIIKWPTQEEKMEIVVPCQSEK